MPKFSERKYCQKIGKRRPQLPKNILLLPDNRQNCYPVNMLTNKNPTAEDGQLLDQDLKRMPLHAEKAMRNARNNIDRARKIYQSMNTAPAARERYVEQVLAALTSVQNAVEADTRLIALWAKDELKMSSRKLAEYAAISHGTIDGLKWEQADYLEDEPEETDPKFMTVEELNANRRK